MLNVKGDPSERGRCRSCGRGFRMFRRKDKYCARSAWLHIHDQGGRFCTIACAAKYALRIVYGVPQNAQLTARAGEVTK